MPLAAAIPTLAVSLAAAAGSVDAPGIAAWASIAAAICGGLPACCSVFDATGGQTPLLVALGVVVPGGGGFTVTSHLALGAALSVASLSLDAEGIAAWLRIAEVFVGWMGDHGSYGPLGFIAYVGPAPPPTGPVTGMGKVQFDNEAIGPPLAVAAGIQAADDVGRAKWAAIGAAVLAAIKSNGEITPAALISPIAGAVTGTGTFA